MISPELLRRYPFFSTLTDAQLRAVAMVSNEVVFEANTNFAEEGKPAAYLYLLMEGDVDLYFSVSEQQRPDTRHEFLVGHINPEEIIGISALINPRAYTVTARTAAKSRLIQINADSLRNLGGLDTELALKLVQQVGLAALDRLNQTRIQLAAAWVEKS